MPVIFYLKYFTHQDKNLHLKKFDPSHFEVNQSVFFNPKGHVINNLQFAINNYISIPQFNVTEMHLIDVEIILWSPLDGKIRGLHFRHE